jgi:hypothetical protein
MRCLIALAALLLAQSVGSAEWPPRPQSVPSIGDPGAPANPPSVPAR